MKKVVTIISAIILISSTLYSQSAFDYGLKISLASSSIGATDTKDPGFFDPSEYYKGNSINPSIGFFLNYNLTSNLILETELSYLPKGSRKTMEVRVATSQEPDGTKNSFYTTAIDLRYLELGLNVKPTLQFGDTPAYLILGVAANYALNAIYVIKDGRKDFLFSYKMGIGCKTDKLLSMPLYFEIKYTGDLTYFYGYEYAKLWNRVFLLSLGINI